MKQAKLAEWLLRWTTTPERAEAELGDLLELRPAKGGWWFWAAVLWLAARQGWRGVTAFYGAAWGSEALMMRDRGVYSPHRFPYTFPDPIWLFKFLPSYLELTGTVCLALFLLAGVRFGPNTKLVQAAGVLGAFAWLIVFFWWQPVVLTSACVVLLFIGARALTREVWRSAIYQLFALSTTYICLMFGEGFLAFLYQKSVAGPLVGTAELHAHPSIAWVWFALHVAAFLGFTRICLFVHQRMSMQTDESKSSSKMNTL